MQWPVRSQGATSWWPIYIRGLAVLFGVSVLILGVHSEPVSPIAVLLLALLLPAGLLSVLDPGRANALPLANATGTLLELLIVSFLVQETGGITSFFYFFYVPVLIWGTVGRGLAAGVVAGWVAAFGYTTAVSMGAAPSAAVLPRAGLLLLVGLMVGLLEQRRVEVTASALRGAEELNRRANVAAEIHATLSEMAPETLPERAHRLLQRAMHLSGAEVGLVMMLDLEGRPVVEASVDANGAERPEGEVLPAAPVFEGMIASGVIQSVVDAAADARWVSVFGKDAAGTAMLFPLRTEGRAFGALYVARHGIRLFADAEMDAVRALAEIASVSLRDAQIHSQAREFLLSTVNTLTAALEAKDPYTRGHSQRVATNAVAIASEIGLAAEEVERIRWASLLHDIGKIGTPEAILRKRGPLTEEERAVMNMHPERGATILGEMAPFRPLVDYVRFHQEAYDGSGYPQGLAAEAIPLGARIIRIADTFDALISDRPYRRGRTVQEAITEMRAMAGSALDPALADVFLRILQVKPPFEVQLRLWRER